MTFQYSFEKILDMKKKEKEKREQEYHQSVTQFEKMATSLYELLRQKEEMEDLYEKQMTKGVKIYQLQHNEKLLLHLQNKISKITQETNVARDQMYRKEDELQSAAIECKRYEKMKEKEKEEYDKLRKQEELKMMDEISIRNYAFVETR
ncbi:flagellar export protein FliJ [Alteribacillus iranensis]|uniref:Flagellar FliJ protein n=1 Tax=Alteribacillus iranensis TaxID=930128 RepID=A0A1I2A4D5_9BACI|nr:flagellar export protein FliJ [Alteribacillus iranensis]SFE38994.1 flagellar FliJ protein [Alteribacillus iranensis]